MFICNLKVNKKTILIFVILLALVIGLFLQFSDVFLKKVPNITDENIDIVIDKGNFIETTKNVHENLEKNIGKKIKITGFVFRMPDFNKDIFVCGRNILINGEDKIAGFICLLENNENFKDDEWVNIYGEITKGEYNNNEMPIIKVEKINKIAVPQDTYVEPLK